MAKILLQVAVLLYAVNAGLSLHCFNCNSKTEPRCADPFDEAALVYNECDSGRFGSLILETVQHVHELRTAFSKYPRKPDHYAQVTCQKLIVDDGGTNVTVRSCSLRELQGTETCAEHRDSIGNNLVFCQQCDSGLCNDASTYYINFFLHMASSIITVRALF